MTSCDDTLKQLPPVPRSVQTVLCTMVGHDPMTGQDIRQATQLPRRTVYAALQTLKQLGILRERPSLRDTRQTFYWIAAPAVPANANSTPPTASLKPASIAA